MDDNSTARAMTFAVGNTSLKSWDVGALKRMQGSELKVWGFGFVVSDLGLVVSGSELGGWSWVFGVWGSWSGVESSGFRVWLRGLLPPITSARITSECPACAVVPMQAQAELLLFLSFSSLKLSDTRVYEPRI